MALVAHQIKGYSALTVRTQIFSGGVNFRCLVVFQFVGRTQRLVSNNSFHFRDQPISLPKEKLFKVSSFKSNGPNNGTIGIDRESKFSNKLVHFSCALQGRDKVIAASPDMTPNELSYASESRESILPRPEAVQKSFKKWLIMLHSQASSEAVHEVYTGKLSHGIISENQEEFLKQKIQNMLKAAFLYFMGLDAATKVLLLIFVPWYSITRAVYGVEVTKELTPLWFLGPLVATVYIRLFQGLCSLYIFCFMQSIRFLENVPIYSMLIYNFVAERKLQALLYIRFCQPILDMKNMDYKGLIRQKLKQLKEWGLEKFLDYVESIWPYYCRMIRFLNKANLLQLRQFRKCKEFGISYCSECLQEI
uniref:Calcium-transporting ATPase PAT1 n=2 Tax=Anthurium amnicola TaxID=1678845 RepID=A0A1D1Y199_9ARAE